jgi:hypothetical protein
MDKLEHTEGDITAWPDCAIKLTVFQVSLSCTSSLNQTVWHSCSVLLTICVLWDGDRALGLHSEGSSSTQGRSIIHFVGFEIHLPLAK